MLTLAISLPAAYGLARFRQKIPSLVIMVLLLSQMVPGISLTIAFFSLFHRLHLLNSFRGLILADSTYSVPFAVLVLRAYLVRCRWRCSRRPRWMAAAKAGCC